MSVRAMMSYSDVEYYARVGLSLTHQEDSEDELVKHVRDVIFDCANEEFFSRK